jgi:formylglycine-generating enzyme required for sulfatase activity
VTNQDYLEALQWALGQGLVTATATSVTAHGVELLDLDDIDCEIAFTPATQQFSLVARSHSTEYGGPGPAYPNGYNPARHPVKELTWYGAACYCDWRSLQENLTPFYNGNWASDSSHDPYAAEGYRLPTEAEWEHAARYNDGRLYPWGNTEPVGCEIANLNCVGWTKPVGLYPQGDNALGLKDLIGNVDELLNDRYQSGYLPQNVNPIGPASGTTRVCRGSDMGDALLVYSQATTRQSYSVLNSHPWLGFRAARSDVSESVHMVLVPAGSYVMGSVGVGGSAIPEHEVTLDAYLIDQYEVTNREYKRFCDATGRTYPIDPGFIGLPNYFTDFPDYPVVYVDWFDANAYAAWVGKRLPTEAEWERAAKGAQDNRLWPWGSTFLESLHGSVYHANVTGAEDGWVNTSPIGFYPWGVSPSGCYDMAGNVWEWCNDWFLSTYYTTSPSVNPQGPASALNRVIRGGNWFNASTSARSAFRGSTSPSYKIQNIGFRCALTP